LTRDHCGQIAGGVPIPQNLYTPLRGGGNLPKRLQSRLPPTGLILLSRKEAVVPAPWPSTPIVRKVAIAGSRRDRAYSLPITRCRFGAGESALQTRPLDVCELRIGRLQAQVGSDIGNELLDATVGAPGGWPPLPRRGRGHRPRVPPTPTVATACYASRIGRGPRAHGLSPPERRAAYFSRSPGSSCCDGRRHAVPLAHPSATSNSDLGGFLLTH